MRFTEGEDLEYAVLQAPIGICILNADTLVAEIVNDKFLDVAGKPYEAIFGQYYWDAFAEARAYYETALAGVIRDGKAYYANEVAVMLIRQGQEENIFVTFVYAPVKDKTGKVKKVAVWVLENTKQVEMREAREQAGQQRRVFETITSTTPDLMYVFDLDYRFTYANSALLAMWGKTEENAIGKTLLENGYEPWHAEMHEREIDQVKATKKPIRGEVSFPHATLGRRVYDYIFTPIFNEQGEVEAVAGTTRDVSDRKHSEDALAQTSEELRAVNKEQAVSNEILTAANQELESLNQKLQAARQKIEEGEVALRLAVSAAHFGTWFIHSVTREFITDARLKELFGYYPDETLSIEQALAQITEEYRGFVAATLENAISNGGDYDVTYPVVGLHDNQLRWLHAIGNLKADASGTFSAFTGVVMDVTERHRAEAERGVYTSELQTINEEMAASNEELTTTNEELTSMQQRLEDTNQELATSASRLRMAIESTKLGTWDYDPRTRALFWSDECREIYGIPVDQPATFDSFSTHIHPDDHDWVQTAIQKALDPVKGGRYELIFRIIRYDNGETRWIKVHGTVYFENSEPVRFIGTVLDITEIKTAEEQSAKLAAIIQSSDDAIISKTLDNIITSWNAGAERIFGYGADEMIGESTYKLIPEDRWGEEPQILARLRAGQRVEHFETKRETKDGRVIDVSLTISPVKDPQGHIIGLSKIARDITEKKLDETRKSDFIGMVSHELKTPLTSLGAIIQVANAKLKDNEDGFLSGAMQKADRQVKRMSAMINGFLNISRLESGKIHIEKQDFDLEELITEVIAEAELTAGTHLIYFEKCQPILVNADRDKIGSVISNYISNAVKYSPKSKNIQLVCTVKNNQVIFSVKDEGMGIRPDDLEKIFDRYYRVEANHTRHISGFGIGLYLSSEIIHGHGGRVWAESESGVGSTFYFSLPLHAGPTRAGA